MLSFLLSSQAWLSALAVFGLRVTDMTMDTMRMLFVMRGKKKFAWFLGFFQSIIYIVAISSVLAHLDNPLTVIGYGAGFATGNVLGMYLEERLAIGFTQIQVVSSRRGSLIMEQLRAAGYGVTEIPARGMDGSVQLINLSVARRDVSRVDTIVLEADPDAFITAEDVRPIRRGFWRE
jgi:uncharacterized protein YebE (UPF0316 family)